MNTQPEALRLADVSRLSRHHEWHLQVDAELRRLHAQRDALLEALKRAEPLLIGPILLQARAAIAAAEGEKT